MVLSPCGPKLPKAAADLTCSVLLNLLHSVIHIPEVSSKQAKLMVEEIK